MNLIFTFYINLSIWLGLKPKSKEVMHRWSRAVLPSIHIEPVDSDEYNQSLVEQLTTFHKRKFLQHVRDKPNILYGEYSADFFFCFSPKNSRGNFSLQPSISILWLLAPSIERKRRKKKPQMPQVFSCFSFTHFLHLRKEEDTTK